MQKLMAIFAHPDDEGAIAGTLAHYAQQGVEVTLVCGTRGEVGEISDPALATPETLGAVRTKELERACEILGIQRLEFLGYRDSGMDGTSENKDPRALVQAGPEAIKAQLVGLMRQHKPDVVITFEPFGWYGHPDHIAVSKWVTEVYPSVGDASAYREQGEAWHPSRLYHAVIPFSRFGAMIEEAVAAGYLQMDGDGGGPDVPMEQQMKTETAVTHVIDVQALFDLKQEGMQAHQTQFGEDSMFRKIPPEMMRKATPDEHFIQISPVPDKSLAENRLDDLFVDV
ncbi:MAG: PIG-L family deacetylase [Chloroflexota bacterium]